MTRMKLLSKRRDPDTIAMGDCFRWAYRDVIAHGGTLVQGLVIHPWSKKVFEHAWVERSGHAYDWQTIVLRQQPAMTLPVFSKTWKPYQTVRYSPERADRELLLQKNFGPWTCAPQLPASRTRARRDPTKAAMMELTPAQQDALTIAYENRGSVYAGWQVGLRGRKPPKGSTLQALARKGLVTLTQRSGSLFATLTDAGWVKLEAMLTRA